MSTLIVLIAGGLNLYLGLLVQSRGGANKKSNSFFIAFAHASALLCLLGFLFHVFESLLILKLSYAVAVVTPVVATFWAFGLVKRQPPKLIAWGVTLVSAGFFLLAIFTDLIVKKVNYVTVLGFNGQFGEYFNYYSLFIVIVIFLIAYILSRGIATDKGVVRFQLVYVLMGLILYGISASFFCLILPLVFDNYNLTIMDAPSSLFFIGFSSYAIIRYRLMGIRTLINKIYTYFSLSVFGLTIFYLGIVLENAFFGGVFSAASITFNVAAVAVYSWGILPVIDLIQRSGDTLFYRGNNPKKIIKDMALRLSSSIDIDELMNILSAEFKKILATEDVDVFLFQKDANKPGKAKNICMSYLRNKDKRLVVGGLICEATINQQRIIVRDESEHKHNTKMVEQMDKLDAKVISPLVYRGSTIGLILLGAKIEGSAYNQDDIEFLEIISSQAAVAIENAHLYKEVDDFNQTLQQKVDAQTKEIRDKAEHLKKLMDMRSEFLDITSHQLRTPVTVIKGVLSMLEEGSIPPAKRKEFLRGAFEKSIKLGEIINDILRASEMDSERFELNLRPTDLNEILKKIEEDKLRTSQRKNIVLKFRLPKKPLPLIMSDEKYIEQAIVNLINNSFQYTLKGSINVSVEALPKSVVIRVADTGIGIPKDDIPKLYSKFARAENAVQTYTDGSGLGLFIIKQIVDATPGAKIEIEKTEIGKGTTFALTLPIAKAS
jgi:signal transduction histidine kinase